MPIYLITARIRVHRPGEMFMFELDRAAYHGTDADAALENALARFRVTYNATVVTVSGVPVVEEDPDYYLRPTGA